MRKLVFIAFNFFSLSIFALPDNFVYLKAIDPSIIQEMRYATNHNFVGRKVVGYQSERCILTRDAALALKKVQTQLVKKGLSLKVYDCYRPTRAVDDFIHWSKISQDQKMKTEFYPRVDKSQFFKLGYVATHSGHSRGSTVDLTIVDLRNLQQAKYREGQTLKNCFAPRKERFDDNSIEMGSGYDCLDEVAHFDAKDISPLAHQNRTLLRTLMIENGFEPYEKEWWHFTLKNEPYPNSYFNFVVQ